MLLALQKHTAGNAGKLFQLRKVKKHYVALVTGSFDPLPENKPHVFTWSIASCGADDFRMTIGTTDNPGRAAETKCWVLQHGTYHGNPVTKVLLEPHTGRRHQLRIHLKAAKHPIVGDATYNSKDSQLEGSTQKQSDELQKGEEIQCSIEPPRMMLHAWRLFIDLPGVPNCVESEDPFQAHSLPGLELPDQTIAKNTLMKV